MDNRHILVAEIKGLLMAMEKESTNVRYQLAFDNVYDVHCLDRIKQYIDVIATKMTKPDETLSEEDLF